MIEGGEGRFVEYVGSKGYTYLFIGPCAGRFAYPVFESLSISLLSDWHSSYANSGPLQMGARLHHLASRNIKAPSLPPKVLAIATVRAPPSCS